MEYFALAAIIALVVSFVIGTIFDINLGLLCIITGILASIICGGDGFEVIDALNPSYLVLLVGILYMFTIAYRNGTMEKVCIILLRLVRGKRVLMPFGMALTGAIVCGLGPGGMATSSLLNSPVAVMSKKTKIDPVLMATTTMHGIFAGQFTPISALAIPILAYLTTVGYPNLGFKIMSWNAALELAMVFFAFLVFGGRKLLKKEEAVYSVDLGDKESTKFNIRNWVSLISIILLILNILTIQINAGIVALLLGLVMMMFERKGGLKDSEVIKAMPWGTVLMVLGAMALLDVMGEAGGTMLIVNAINSLDIGVFGLLLLIAAAGLMSFYATSIPVILAILPLGIELCNTMNMPNLIPGMMVAVCIAGTMVDVSPMSTSGAMFLASAVAVNETLNQQKMFRKMFFYGLSMIAIGSIASWLLFVILGI